VLRPRSARIELASPGVTPLVPMEPDDAKLLCWRLLATLAGALAPGEIIDVALRSDRRGVSLEIDLPASLAGNGDPFAATTPSQPRAVSAGMFGTGFTLRLARAEAEAAGGRLQADNDRLRLVLPALTRTQGDHTVEREGNGGAAA
jgi:two-component system, OmpR family, sensor kinase